MLNMIHGNEITVETGVTGEITGVKEEGIYNNPDEIIVNQRINKKNTFMYLTILLFIVVIVELFFLLKKSKTTLGNTEIPEDLITYYKNFIEANSKLIEVVKGLQETEAIKALKTKEEKITADNLTAIKALFKPLTDIKFVDDQNNNTKISKLNTEFSTYFAKFVTKLQTCQNKVTTLISNIKANETTQEAAYIAIEAAIKDIKQEEKKE